MFRRWFLAIALLVGAVALSGAPSQAVPLGATAPAGQTAENVATPVYYYYRTYYRPRYRYYSYYRPVYYYPRYRYRSYYRPAYYYPRYRYYRYYRPAYYYPRYRARYYRYW